MAMLVQTDSDYDSVALAYFIQDIHTLSAKYWRPCIIILASVETFF